MRAWWIADDTGSTYHGFDQSVQELRKIFAEQGPFTGILGKNDLILNEKLNDYRI